MASARLTVYDSIMVYMSCKSILAVTTWKLVRSLNGWGLGPANGRVRCLAPTGERKRWLTLIVLGALVLLVAAYMAFARNNDQTYTGDTFEGTTPREGVKLPISTVEEMDRRSEER